MAIFESLWKHPILYFLWYLNPQCEYLTIDASSNINEVIRAVFQSLLSFLRNAPKAQKAPNVQKAQKPLKPQTAQKAQKQPS